MFFDVVVDGQELMSSMRFNLWFLWLFWYPLHHRLWFTAFHYTYNIYMSYIRFLESNVIKLIYVSWFLWFIELIYAHTYTYNNKQSPQWHNWYSNFKDKMWMSVQKGMHLHLYQQVANSNCSQFNQTNSITRRMKQTFRQWYVVDANVQVFIQSFVIYVLKTNVRPQVRKNTHGKFAIP